MTNNMSNKHYNNEHVLNLKKDYSSKNYISNNYKSQIAYVENNLYKRSDSKAFNNTNNIFQNKTNIQLMRPVIIKSSKFQIKKDVL